MPGARPPPPLPFRWSPSLIGLAAFAAIGVVGALRMFGGVPATFVAVVAGIIIFEARRRTAVPASIAPLDPATGEPPAPPGSRGSPE